MSSKQATSPEELWAILSSGTLPHKVVDFPRKIPNTDDPIGRVTMVVLTQGEQMAANAEAEKEVRRLLREGKDVDYDSEGRKSLLQNAAALELVWRCLRDPSDPKLEKTLFASKATLRDETTPDEVAVLVQQYLMMRLDVGPIVGEMSEDEMEVWLDTMARVGIFDPLGSASLALLIGLVIFSAKRLHALRTANFSSGSPPDATTTSATTETSPPESASATG